MEIEEGFLLSLKCRVEGDSNPKIHWFKDGVPINSIHNPNADITVAFQKSQLRIKNMQLSDSGNYSCLGASETNRMSRWVYVTVLPKTDERKVADEKAYNVCPVNMCNVGNCLMINNQPVCRCPPTHTGSNCSQLLVHPSSSASRSTTKTATMEKDFILDQTQSSNTTSSFSLTDVMDDYFDRCDLQEFKHSPECAQVNSHFYAFIGTAIACSVIILLLGSCLGYIRRRKILNRQNRLQTTRSNGDTHVDDVSAGAVFPKNDDSHRKLPRNENSKLDTSVFTRPASGRVTPTMMMTCRTTKMDSTTTRLCSAMHLSKANSVSPILNAVHPHPPPSSPAAYVVLTSTQSINQPLQLHPIAEFVMPSSIIGTSSTNPNHESSPSRLRAELNLSTQAVAHAETENTHRMEYGHMFDTTSQVFQRFHQINAYPNPAEVGEMFECSQTPVSLTTTPSCTQQIFVQIPNLPAPIFFDNQTDQSTALIGNVLTESQSSFPTTQLAIDLYGNSNRSPTPGTHTGTALLIDSNHLCTTQEGKFLMDGSANPDCVPQTKIEEGHGKARNAESYLIAFQPPGQVMVPAKSNTFHLPDLT